MVLHIDIKFIGECFYDIIDFKIFSKGKEYESIVYTHSDTSSRSCELKRDEYKDFELIIDGIIISRKKIIDG